VLIGKPQLYNSVQSETSKAFEGEIVDGTIVGVCDGDFEGELVPFGVDGTIVGVCDGAFVGENVKIGFDGTIVGVCVGVLDGPLIF
jgi:hypothetical protein